MKFSFFWVFLCFSWPTSPSSAAEPSEFLADGVKVIVQPRPDSQTVAAAIFFLGGRQNTTPANAGIEALMVGSALEGTQKFPRDLLRSETARLAAVFDFQYHEDYSFVGLRCTTDSFARSFEILADAALHPAFDPADVERVRAKLIAAAASDGDIDLVRQRRVEAVIYRDHPYLPSSEGTPGSLRSISIDALRDHHRQVLQKARMLVVVSGGLDADAVKRITANLFSELPPGAPPAVVPPLHFAAASGRQIPFELSIARAEIAFAGPPGGSPDIPALKAVENLLKNRIFEVVRNLHALSYDPAAELTISRASHGSIRFSATAVDEVAKLVQLQIEWLKKNPIPDSLLSAVAIQLQANEYGDAQTNDAVVERLGEYEIVRGGWRHSLETPYAALTAAQIQQAAQKYLTDFQYVVLTPPGLLIDEKAFSR